ncbi:MAG: branched-chain amino acid ABC transporter permease [Ramlibacter sp.]|nr:branched-chain amino acid ABC transporter permease [Ramlibacter sp.]
MKTNLAWVLAGALVLLLAVPVWLPAHWVGALSTMLIAALFALAFSLLMGQAGMLSFGHGAYFAIGCFATVHAMRAIDAGALGLPTPLLPLVGGVAGLVVGAAAGFFATLRSGVYFSMVTLAIAELLHAMAPNMQRIFGGESGISSMRQPWAGIGFGSEREVYYLVLAWVLIAGILMFLYTRTSFGRLTVALRENERRVAFLGFNVHRAKIVVFAVSCMFAGIAGGLLALTNESANYLLFSMSYSANVVLFSYIGGIGTFVGPAIGAAAMTLFGFAVSDLTRLWLLYQGLIFVVVMMYAPAGLVEFVATQSRQLLRGEGPTPARRVASFTSAAVIAASTVFLCELAGAILSRDYQAQRLRTGAWEAVSIFGSRWSPDHWATWLVPMLAFLLAAAWLAHGNRPRRPRIAVAPLPEAQTAQPASLGEAIQ